MAFEKIDELDLGAVCTQARNVSESAIYGALYLQLDCYETLSTAGYLLRDSKADNMMVKRSEDGIRFVVVDTDACCKIGCIDEEKPAVDAMLECVSQRNIGSLCGKQSFCTAHSANYDIQSKHASIGEQAIVFSMTELALRLAGDDTVVWQLSYASSWEEVLSSTARCSTTGQPYSSEFHALMKSWRRRTFTSGSADAFLDLSTARRMLDVVTNNSRDVCVRAFEDLYCKVAKKMGPKRPALGNKSLPANTRLPTPKPQYATFDSTDSDNDIQCLRHGVAHVSIGS